MIYLLEHAYSVVNCIEGIRQSLKFNFISQITKLPCMTNFLLIVVAIGLIINQFWSILAANLLTVHSLHLGQGVLQVKIYSGSPTVIRSDTGRTFDLQMPNSTFIPKMPDTTVIQLISWMQIIPEYRAPYRFLGQIAAINDQLDIAQELLERAQQAKSNDAWAYFWQGRVHWQSGRHEAAVKNWETSFRIIRSFQVWLIMSNAVYAAGEPVLAIETLKYASVMPGAPADADKVVVETLRRFIWWLSPTHSDMLHWCDETLKAAPMLGLPLSARPASAPLHATRALALLMLGRQKDASTALQTSLDLQETQYAHVVAGVKMIVEGDGPRGVQTIRTALTTLPDDSFALILGGNTLRNQGFIAEGCTMLWKASQLQPNFAEMVKSQCPDQ